MKKITTAAQEIDSFERDYKLDKALLWLGIEAINDWNIWKMFVDSIFY